MIRQQVPQKNKRLKDQIGLIMRKLRNCSEEELGRMMEQIFILEEFKDVKERVISLLVGNGKIVYIQKNGLFSNLSPECYERDMTKTNGAIHIMEWKNNLFLVLLSRESTQCIRRIYELQIDSSLIVQTNWTSRQCKQFGGNPIPAYEALVTNCIKKMSSAVLKPTANKTFSLQQKQDLQIEMPQPQPRPQSMTKGNFQIKDKEAQRYQTPNKVDAMSEERAYVNKFIEKYVVDQYKKGSWRFLTIYEGCQVLLLEGYIVGLVQDGELISLILPLSVEEARTIAKGVGSSPGLIMRSAQQL